MSHSVTLEPKLRINIKQLIKPAIEPYHISVNEAGQTYRDLQIHSARGG